MNQSFSLSSSSSGSASFFFSFFFLILFFFFQGSTSTPGGFFLSSLGFSESKVSLELKILDYDSSLFLLIQAANYPVPNGLKNFFSFSSFFSDIFCSSLFLGEGGLSAYLSLGLETHYISYNSVLLKSHFCKNVPSYLKILKLLSTLSLGVTTPVRNYIFL